MHHLVRVLLALTLITGVAVAQEVLTPGDAPLNEVAVPSDFYTFQITDNGGVAPGYNYIGMETRNRATGESISYLAIMDSTGSLLYFKHAPLGGYHMKFTPHPEVGLLSYAIDLISPGYIMVVMDDTFTPIDTIQTGTPEDSLYLDVHDLIIDPDTTYWIENRFVRTIDMSQYITDGNPEAQVMGHEVAHVNRAGDVLWSWKSLDYIDDIPFTSANDTMDLKQDAFEQLHTNAIEFHNDGNILISNRENSEITKIRYNPGQLDDGDVLWRFGGLDGRDFTYSNGTGEAAYDTVLGFTDQHDVRILPNGNITVFDNGSYHNHPRAYGREYAMDEENKTAELVWAAAHPTEDFHAFATGSMRRLSNGNSLIGWGLRTPMGATEFTAEGDIAWEIFWDQTPDWGWWPHSYRYLRSEYLPGPARVPDVVMLPTSDSEAEVTMNWFGHTDVDSFRVYFGTSSEPTTVLGTLENATAVVSGLTAETEYFVTVTAFVAGVESDHSEEWSFTTPAINSVEGPVAALPGTFQLGAAYPNPFNPTTVVPMVLPEAGRVAVKVYDVNGRLVRTLSNGVLSAGSHQIVFDANGLASGVYFLQASAESGFAQTRRLVLVR